MSQIWTSSFPDLTEWTQDPHDSNITPDAGTVELHVPVDVAGVVSPEPKTYPNITTALVTSRFTHINTYLVFDVTLNSIGGSEVAQNICGIFLAQDLNEENAIGINCFKYFMSQYHLRVGKRTTNIALAVGGYYFDVGDAPIRLQIHLNYESGPITTEHGDPLAYRELAMYYSINDGASWVRMDDYPQTLEIAQTPGTYFVPNYVGLYAAASLAEEIIATFGNVTMTAPLLYEQPAKLIAVPRLAAESSGPFNAYSAGDVVHAPSILLTAFATASPPRDMEGEVAANNGRVGFCSNGDTGAPCLTAHDGSAWKRIALGAAIAAV